MKQSDESSFCDQDLLRTFTRSARGAPSARLITNQNSERISLMPAISIGGVLALTTMMDTFKRPKFEKFLEFDLVSFASSNNHLMLILTSLLDSGSLHESIPRQELGPGTGQCYDTSRRASQGDLSSSQNSYPVSSAVLPQAQSN